MFVLLLEAGTSGSAQFVRLGVVQVEDVKSYPASSEFATEVGGVLSKPCSTSCSLDTEPLLAFKSLLPPLSRPASWVSPFSEQLSSNSIGFSAGRQYCVQ